MRKEIYYGPVENHQRTAAYVRATGVPDTPVREKIYGRVENLQRTAAYVRTTGVPVGANDDVVRWAAMCFCGIYGLVFNWFPPSRDIPGQNG